jgi:hypothetical protein
MNCASKTGDFVVSFDFAWYGQTHNKCSRNSSRCKIIDIDEIVKPWTLRVSDFFLVQIRLKFSADSIEV